MTEPETTAAPRRKVLVVEDDAVVLGLITKIVNEAGYEAVGVATGEAALAELDRQLFDAVLLDLNLPGVQGMDVLSVGPTLQTDTPFIVMTAFGSVDTAVEAMKRGAFDYVSKPFRTEELLLTLRRAHEETELRREVARLRRQVKEAGPGIEMVGRSPAIERVRDLIARVAPSRATVLISGDTGTGKELVARSIHHQSGRAERSFVAVNCSAIPETLLESELFGHVRGAFTGATSNKKGKFALADGGTIFLDEIGTMNPTLQAKLLRVLQEREIEPLGSERTEKIDQRVIAATNRDLRQMVADGKFQEDLFYRLNVIPIEIPPLRERRDDIPALIEHFVRKHAQRTGRRVEKIDEGVLAGLQQYDWPGNVRELENAIERAVVLSQGPIISAKAVSVLGAPASQATGLPSLKLRNNIEWVERETIRRALESSGGVKKDAAELMGISQRALSYYLAKYRLDT